MDGGTQAESMNCESPSVGSFCCIVTERATLYFKLHLSLIPTHNFLLMIDQDYKFFRQNFSASSFSEDSPTFKRTQPAQTFKIHPHSHKNKSQFIHKGYKESYRVAKELEMSSGNISKNSRIENKLGTLGDAGKEGQLRILERLRNQHKGIKRMHLQKNPDENLASDHEQQKTPSVKQSVRQKKVVEDMYSSTHLRKEGQRQRRSEASKQIWQPQHDESHSPKELIQQVENRAQESQVYEQKCLKLNNKIQALSQQIAQKDALIKRLRLNEAALEEKYTGEVRQFQSQVQQYKEQVNLLKKEISSKDTQINELKQMKPLKTSDRQLSKLQQELQMMRKKEKEYLGTIKRLEEQSNDNYPGVSTYTNNRDSTNQITAEITRLRQALGQRDEKWTQRLAQAIEKERKAYFSEFQSLISSQSKHRTVAAEDKTQLSSSKYEIMPTLDLLLFQIQQLKRARDESNPRTLVEQLRFIRDFMAKFQRSENQNEGDFSETPSSLDTIALLKTELANYKKFIIEEEKTKRMFLEELNLYREQNSEVIKQNGYLRQQLGLLESNLNNPPAGLNVESGDQQRSLRDRDLKIMRYQQQIQQLQHQLMNSQPQRPPILNRTEAASELHTEIQRLHHLLEAETEHYMIVSQETNAYFENQVRIYEERIRVYEENIRTIQTLLKQNEIRVYQIVSRPCNDSNSLVQLSQLLQQEIAQFRNQLAVSITSNRQVQTQLRQRSQSIDNEWEIKRDQLNNGMLMIQQMQTHQ